MRDDTLVKVINPMRGSFEKIGFVIQRYFVDDVGHGDQVFLVEIAGEGRYAYYANELEEVREEEAKVPDDPIMDEIERGTTEWDGK